jgi:hypothetical protein
VVPFGILDRVVPVFYSNYRKQQESSPAGLESNMSELSDIGLWLFSRRKVTGVFAEGREIQSMDIRCADLLKRADARTKLAVGDL